MIERASTHAEDLASHKGFMGGVTRRAFGLRMGAGIAGGASGLGTVMAGCAPAGSGSSVQGIEGRSAKLAFAYATTNPDQDRLRAGPVQLFRQKYPAVTVEEVTGPSTELKQKILAMVASGTPPDVIHMTNGGAGGAEDLASRGIVLKLDDRIKRDKAIRWDDFWPGAKIAGQYEGAQMGIPYLGISAGVMYFNKELFLAGAQATPDQRSAKKQWTWDVLVDEATQLTKRQPTGELVQAGLGSPLDWSTIAWINILLHSYGADYLDKNGAKVIIDSPQGIQALRTVYELAPRRKTMPLRGEGNSVDLIKAGKVAQALYWFAAASWWRPLSFDWDVAPAPAGPAGSTPFGVVDLLGIARDTKDQDAAWALVTFLSLPEIDAERAFGFGAMVVRPSAVPAWRERMKTQKPKNLDLIEETVKTLSIPALRKPHPAQPEVDNILLREFTALLHDGKPPEQVAGTIAAEGNALLGAR